MFNYRVMNANKVCAFVTGLLNKCIPVSFADEGNDKVDKDSLDSNHNSPTNNGAGSIINFEELMARARKEEKDKLYPEINKLKNDLKLMTESNNANLLKVGELQHKLDSYENGEETEEVKALRQKVEDLQNENKNLRESQPDVESIKAQCKSEYEVELYRVQQIATDDIKTSVLPMFMDDIKGSTKEEIDASIQLAKEKTLQVKEQLGLSKSDNNTESPAKDNNGGNGSDNNTDNSGTSLFGNLGFRSANTPPVANPTDPTHGSFEGDNGWDYVKNLDLSTPEGRKKYAEWRQRVGLR